MDKNTIEKPLHVGKTDSYSITIDPDWLNGESITTTNITVDNAYINLDSTSIVDNIIYMFLTGVAAKGGTDIHIDYTTATRSDCDHVRVIVQDC